MFCFVLLYLRIGNRVGLKKKFCNKGFYSTVKWESNLWIGRWIGLNKWNLNDGDDDWLWVMMVVVFVDDGDDGDVDDDNDPGNDSVLHFAPSLFHSIFFFFFFSSAIYFFLS